MADWQPIETAPRDGTPIRLRWQGEPPLSGDDTPDMQVVARWNGSHFVSVDDVGMKCKNATHWMPLPAPPA